jgi:hypothetical protein
MSPLALAIDGLQSENDAYLGKTLPTLHSLKRKMEALKSQSFRYCKPLVDAILEGLTYR